MTAWIDLKATLLASLFLASFISYLFSSSPASRSYYRRVSLTWLSLAFGSWLLSYGISLYFPLSWIESIYLFFRQLLAPFYLKPWPIWLIGEKKQVEQTLRPILHLLLTLLFWWLLAGRPIRLPLADCLYPLIVIKTALSKLVRILTWSLGTFLLTNGTHSFFCQITHDPLIPLVCDLPTHTLAWAIKLAEALLFRPVVEELLFRHWLLRTLSTYLPFGLPLFFSSALFALAHSLTSQTSDLATGLTLMLLGGCLSLCYKKTSLLSVILVHASYQALEILSCIYFFP